MGVAVPVEACQSKPAGQGQDDQQQQHGRVSPAAAGRRRAGRSDFRLSRDQIVGVGNSHTIMMAASR